MMIPGTDLLDALPVAVYTTDADGRITYYNEAAAELWGHRPQVGTDQWCGSWRLFRLDGTPLPHDECPMAVALREGRPVRGVEAIAERPDGTRVHFAPYPTPLRDGSGRLTGAINLLMDVTDRQRTAFESAHRAAIVASSDDAIISKTLEGRVTSWNGGATRIFGYQANEMIGQPILRLIPPELHDEETTILGKLKRGEYVQHYETTRVAKDGRRIEVSLSVSPLRDESGRVVGASKIARDITDRRRAERLQRLLNDELNHRVKNTLATVIAIATQSLHHSDNPREFVPGFTGRVRALAKAHDLLLQRHLQGASLIDLVREQVLLGNNDDDRVSCSGPLLMLDAQAAVHLALVLHELGTNARKYGALSVPSGRLSVSWMVRTSGGRNLLLQWMERGGPKVSAPSARGFGTTLIEQTLAVHGGDATIQYDADGVTCEFRLPLPEQAMSDFAAMYQPATELPATHAGLDRLDLRGKRILVVEDEPLVAMDVEASLATAGCEVVGPAGTLERAKQLVASAQFDAALVDANLAGRPVDELAAALTQRNVPFAFVTGYGRETLPQAFREAIMLGKPFSEEELLATVGRLFRPTPEVARLRSKKI